MMNSTDPDSPCEEGKGVGRGIDKCSDPLDDLRANEWWIPLLNKSEDGVVYLEPRSWKPFKETLLSAFKKYCNISHISEKIESSVVMFHPKHKGPVVCVTCNWKDCRMLEVQLQTICNDLHCAAVIDIKSRCLAFINSEMASLSDTVWRSLNWSTVPYRHKMHMYTRTLASKYEGAVVMMGPFYDYCTKTWSSKVALWVLHDNQMARHFLCRIDEQRVLYHLDLPVQHYYGAIWQHTIVETLSCQVRQWSSCAKAQVGTAFYYDADDRHIGMATIGPGIASLSPTPTDGVAKLYLTASHTFTTSSLKPGASVYGDGNLQMSIGTYVGQVPNTLLGVIELNECDSSVKVAVDCAGHIVQVCVNDVIDIDSEVYSDDVFKTGSASATTAGRTRSFGSVMIPNQKHYFSDFLIVERSQSAVLRSFSVEGDSGGPVYGMNNNTEGTTLRLYGMIDGCITSIPQYSTVIPISHDVTAQVLDFCLNRS